MLKNQMFQKTYQILALKYHLDKTNGRTAEAFTIIKDAYDKIMLVE